MAVRKEPRRLHTPWHVPSPLCESAQLTLLMAHVAAASPLTREVTQARWVKPLGQGRGRASIQQDPGTYALSLSQRPG